MPLLDRNLHCGPNGVDPVNALTVFCWRRRSASDKRLRASGELFLAMLFVGYELTSQRTEQNATLLQANPVQHTLAPFAYRR